MPCGAACKHLPVRPPGVPAADKAQYNFFPCRMRSALPCLPHTIDHPMQNSTSSQTEIAALVAAAIHSTKAGKEEEAGRMWARVLELDPHHVMALTALGKRAFRYGDMETARRAFDRLVAADGANPQNWISLALACQGLKDEAAEEEAIRRALVPDPTDLVALILRANFLER